MWQLMLVPFPGNFGNILNIENMCTQVKHVKYIKYRIDIYSANEKFVWYAST